jgi:hypothetical protein
VGADELSASRATRPPPGVALARVAGAFAYLDKGTMARRVHRVLLGAAVHAVLAANAGRD